MSLLKSNGIPGEDKPGHPRFGSFRRPSTNFTDAPRTSIRHASRMTTARSQLVPPGAEGCYHCIQRCVRRAFLCGTDSYTGRSFAHRKTWIEDRLQLLGSCFAAAIHAYAVMDNHLHLVIQVMPDSACNWSDDDVADRWTRLFPPSGDDPAAFELRRQRLLADPALLVSCLPDPLDPSSPDLCEPAPCQAACLNSASCCIDSSSFAFAAFAHPCHRGNVM